MLPKLKIRLIWIGKAKQKFTKEATDLYLKRLKHYAKIEVVEQKDVKANSSKTQKEKEAKLFEKYVEKGAYSICLDEKGKEYTSIGLSKMIASLQNQSTKEINIIIGGAFGFQSSILEKANAKWSLSQLTLPHDMCRILLPEPLYRSFTILNNEKYHNP